MEKVRLTPVLVVAAAAALVGPLATTPRDKPANALFVFTPPPGFVPANEDVVKALGTVPDLGKVWIVVTPGSPVTPNITLTFSKQSPQLDEEDLRALAAGMPAVFTAQGSTWTEVRHETRRRPDGTRVGIIDGELTQSGSKKRVLQIVFPIDTGAALVTASVPAQEMTDWEPKLDASILSATGVATRAPKAPAWLYAAWGVAGGVLAFLTLALFARKKKA